MVWVKSKTEWSGEQMIDIISSACQDYFFYGKEIFDEKTNFFKKLCNEQPCIACNPALGSHVLGYHIKDSTFFEWSELVQRFHSYK